MTGPLMTSQKDAAARVFACVPPDGIVPLRVPQVYHDPVTGNPWGAFAADLRSLIEERKALLDALCAAHSIRPENWDDDEDPAQVAAWKLVAAAVGKETADVG